MEDKIIAKFKLQGFEVKRLQPDFDGFEVYMASPEGGTEKEPLCVGIPMVFLVKGEEITQTEPDMALMLLGKYSDSENE